MQFASPNRQVHRCHACSFCATIRTQKVISEQNKRHSEHMSIHQSRGRLIRFRNVYSRDTFLPPQWRGDVQLNLSLSCSQFSSIVERSRSSMEFNLRDSSTQNSGSAMEFKLNEFSELR